MLVAKKKSAHKMFPNAADTSGFTSWCFSQYLRLTLNFLLTR